MDTWGYALASVRFICGTQEVHRGPEARLAAFLGREDSHAVGVLGGRGRGTPEHCGAEGRVQILTGTLGKALGGASGGYLAGNRETVAWLRQRARPYLFSNTLPPALAAAAVTAIDMAEAGSGARLRLRDNAAHFRAGLEAAGFPLTPGSHPIIPVLIGDARKAKLMAGRLLELGVYAVAFSFPVVPEGKARIRAQISAAHTREQLDSALRGFRLAGQETGVVP